MADPFDMILPQSLTPAQRRVVSHPREGGGCLILQGLPGTGKSTALLARLAALLSEGRRPYEILFLVPQRAQGRRYERALAALDAPTRGGVDILTFYGLSRRAISLFWPLVSKAGGFAWPDREPTFLTIETTQYFMWCIVEPLIAEKGYFSELAIRRERLLSQLIDNLNKAALVGFDHRDVYRRLQGAWTGDSDHVNYYWQTQDCISRFRDYCLAHNLLDFSLITQTYHRHLLSHPAYQRYFRSRYRHLLVDNLEENVPVAQEFIVWAKDQCASSVLAHDEGGGYRIFLGADAEGAADLASQGDEVVVFDELLGAKEEVVAFSNALRRVLRVKPVGRWEDKSLQDAVVDQDAGRYWISMIRWMTERVAMLVEKGVAPADIAIVAPYVSEVMRFAIEEELCKRDVDIYLLRPSTPLRDDPVVRGLLVLALLAHPQWDIHIQGQAYVPPQEDVALALEVALANLDPIRARRLADMAYSFEERMLIDLSGEGEGGPPHGDLGRLWEQVGYQIREPYEALRVWLENYRRGEPAPLDVFFSKLFGDVLSRSGYGFYDEPDKARVFGRLVESTSKFHAAVGFDDVLEETEVAREFDTLCVDHGGVTQSIKYVELVLGGIASAEYLLDWPDASSEEAVILAPAYTYLTRDIRSDYQFWIDLGSDGWSNRPNQPLTHPYVLSKHWPVGQPWRDIEEEQAKREALGRVLLGLATRCRKGVYLAFSDLDIGGVEQSSRLERAIVSVLTQRSPNG
ncbi:MAG: hypothetical protein U9R48_11505 [Chloroflexota bacterium]|nr:hypothetical protein [Chloroflexota bacterium]